jgi:hypothetical protein
MIGWIEEEQLVTASSTGLRRRLRIQAEAGRPASAAERRWLSAAPTTGQTVNWETGCLRECPGASIVLFVLPFVLEQMHYRAGAKAV